MKVGNTSPSQRAEMDLMLKFLFDAVRNLKHDKVETILNDHKTLVNYARKGDWFTPLHCAVSKNDLRMVELLLNRGADPNKIAADPAKVSLNEESASAITPFDLAIKTSGTWPSIITSLIGRNGKFDPREMSLYFQQRNKEKRDISSFKELIFGERWGATSDLKKLIFGEKAISAEDFTKSEDMRIFYGEFLFDAIETHNYKEVQDILTDYGCLVNHARVWSGVTPLHCAVSKNNQEMVELVLRFSADPNKLSMPYKSYKVQPITPLDLALTKYSTLPPIITKLISCGGEFDNTAIDWYLRIRKHFHDDVTSVKELIFGKQEDASNASKTSKEKTSAELCQPCDSIKSFPPEQHVKFPASEDILTQEQPKAEAESTTFHATTLVGDVPTAGEETAG